MAFRSNRSLATIVCYADFYGPVISNSVVQAPAAAAPAAPAPTPAPTPPAP